MSIPITWGGSGSVSGASSVNSDPVSTQDCGFSYVVQVTGTGPGGISGNLSILVSNDGVSYSPLAGSILSVFLGQGESQAFSFSSQTAFSSVELSWVVGSNVNGILSNGSWSIVPAPTVGPVPVPAIPVPISSTMAGLFQAINSAYGVDVMCLTDLDPNFSLVQNALPQDVWHLISEQPGTIFWSPNQTFSIRSMLSKGIMPASLSATAATIQAVIAADERVAQVQCNVTQTGPETVEIQLQVFPEQGTAFQLVAAIGKVTITLISVGLVNL